MVGNKNDLFFLVIVFFIWELFDIWITQILLIDTKIYIEIILALIKVSSSCSCWLVQFRLQILLVKI